MNTRYNPTKFPYTSLNRSETNGKRHYVSPDGSKLPSVTTILSATKTEEDKQKLNEWKKRTGEEKAREITTEAASRGTRVHKWLEKYVVDGKIDEPGSNPYSQQSHAMAQRIIQQGLIKCQEFWGIEISLYLPHMYAGTTDLVGVHEGKPSILDFKQSNKEKKREWINDYFLQLVAYAECHNELYGTDIDRGVVLMCTPDLKYQEFILEAPEFNKYRSLWFTRLEEYYTKFA